MKTHATALVLGTFALLACLPVAPAANSTQPTFWQIVARLLGIDASLHSEASMARSPFEPHTGEKLARYDLQTRTETILWTAKDIHSPVALPGGGVAVLRHALTGTSTTETGVWTVGTPSHTAEKQLTSQTFARLLGVTPDGRSLLALGVPSSTGGAPVASAEGATGGAMPSAEGSAQPVRSLATSIALYAIDLTSGSVQPVNDSQLSALSPLSVDHLSIPRQSEYNQGRHIMADSDGKIIMMTLDTPNAEYWGFGPNDRARPGVESDTTKRLDPIWLGADSIAYIIK